MLQELFALLIQNTDHLQLRVYGCLFQIQLNPKKIPFDAPKESMLYQVDVDGTIEDIAVLSIGNPHAIITVDNTENAEVERP